MTEQIDREPVNDWHSDLDHFDPEFVADPYPIYEDLRGQCPVAHSDRYGGMTWLTKASDVAAAAVDPIEQALDVTTGVGIEEHRRVRLPRLAHT